MDVICTQFEDSFDFFCLHPHCKWRAGENPIWMSGSHLCTIMFCHPCNSYTHISVRYLYISRIGLSILLHSYNWTEILGIYKSLTDTWMWKLGLRRNSSVQVIELTDYQAFSPVVRIGTPHSLTHCPLHFWFGGGVTHSLEGEVYGEVPVRTKEVNKEQSSYRNLSATATRVLQCTCPVAASRKDCSAIGNYIVNMIRYMYKTDGRVWVDTQKQERLRPSLRWNLLLVLYTAFNLFGIKIYASKSYVFTIWHKFRPLGISESVTYQTHLADKVL